MFIGTCQRTKISGKAVSEGEKKHWGFSMCASAEKTATMMQTCPSGTGAGFTWFNKRTDKTVFCCWQSGWLLTMETTSPNTDRKGTLNHWPFSSLYLHREHVQQCDIQTSWCENYFKEEASARGITFWPDYCNVYNWRPSTIMAW